ncbi:Xanthine phosphoribosyltransferase 1 [Linnemannia zychae]|nr:Xanthine phosphoribosyltransferase 1 [Linnemannia zychae]
MRPKPVPPAEPVERRAIPELRTLRSGRVNPYTEPSLMPSWTSLWLRDQKLDANAIEVTDDIKSRAQEKLDIVYTWVNGTDANMQAIKEKYKETSPLFLYFQNITLQTSLLKSKGKGSNREPSLAEVGSNRTRDQTVHRFRDNNELKYSLRSLSEYVPEDMLGRIYILTTEVPDSEGKPVGQVPEWLGIGKAVGEKVKLVKHREIFDDPSVLPSFNSLSIESQMHHVPNLTDTFIYFNDDIFVGAKVNTSDFYTPLYGFVFHFTAGIVDPAIPTLGTSPNIGEWQSLQYTNYVLSKQFGARHRAYISHIIHIMNTPILEEMQAIWPEEFEKTASHRFRGEGEAQEINLAYFFAHYVMERLRETQLESYWKYRLDRNQDGVLDWEEREVLIQLIEAYEKGLASNSQRRGMRTQPIDPKFQSFLQNHIEKLESVGITWTGRTSYDQSGMDGYPFMIRYADLSRSSSDQKGHYSPSITKTEAARRQCQFNIDFCFGSQFRNKSAPIEEFNSSTGAGSLFERVAFTEYHCGDCLLHIVRRVSQTPGMSAVMPVDRTSPEYARVARDMSKYNYVIGRSQFSFVQLTTGDKSEAALNRLLVKNTTETYFCINDDIPDSRLIAKRVRGLFANFLETRLPNPSPWELF